VRAEAEAQFREFVTGNQAALLSTACLLAGDWASGEDLLQTALTKTYLAWPRIRDRAAAVAYVRRVMSRTAITWWRRRWRAEWPTADPPERPVGDDTGLADDRDLVWQAVRRLPPGQRAVLVLRFHADLTEAQTADTLGISVGTVKSQTARALARLRAALGEPAVQGGRE
jgi:RNA polymerase sigma-70 factor (ECF subfamily)